MQPALALRARVEDDRAQRPVLPSVESVRGEDVAVGEVGECGVVGQHADVLAHGQAPAMASGSTRVGDQLVSLDDDRVRASCASTGMFSTETTGEIASMPSFVARAPTPAIT